MLNLPVFQPGVIEAPTQMFRCAFYKATIAAGVCIARQKHRVSVIGAGHRRELRVAGQYKYCASGQCDQGQIIALRLEGYEPESEEQKKDRKRAAYTIAGKEKVAAIEKKLEQTEPAPPAEDKKVPIPSKLEKMTDDEIRRAHAATGSLKDLMAELGGVGRNAVTKRLASMGLNPKLGRLPTKGGGRTSRKPPTLDRVAEKHAAAPADDLVGLIRHRLKFHQAEAAKCERALEALQ